MELLIQKTGLFNWFEKINHLLNGIVWGPFMLALLVGVGVYFTIRTGGFQLKKLKFVFKHTIGGIFEKDSSQKKGTVSPLQATATALAGTMGTGNIVGIATAMTAGGAGAVFWMWVSAFFGMITKYAEIVLSVKFRQKNEKGELVGGPMYYLEKGLGQRWLAVLFAIFCMFASFGIGNMTQINSISQTLQSSFQIQPWVSGVMFAVLVGIVIIGGIKRITGVTAALIPILSIFYILGAVVAIFLNLEKIPSAFSLIFEEAFNLRAVGGGALGYTFMTAVRFGFSRGVFSNEAGLGSAPIAHAAADTDSPAIQGLWGIFEVFIDTILVCTLTALVILTSGTFEHSGLDGADLTGAAFSNSLGGFAGIFLSISVTLFAFATLVGWSYYGEKCIEYLFQSNWAITIYRMIYVLLVAVGAIMELRFVWSISDTLNGFMAIPNLIGVIGLSRIVIQETKKLNQLQ